MNEKLKEKTNESLSSVLPITAIVLLLSLTLVPMEIGTIALFLTGAVLLILLVCFFMAARLPEMLGHISELTDKRSRILS